MAEKLARDLQSYAYDEWSQHGEDGILARVFELLGTDHNEAWCVEFGAWDGVHLSNTYRLISQEAWHAVLIEANSAKFRELQNNMRGFPRVVCLNEFVDLDPPHDLGSILGATALPIDFDLLSIDVDGIDYHVWEAFTCFQPKVVVVEINPTIPNHVEFVQPRDSGVHQGSSLLALTRLAARKGYELVAVTKSNAIFVRSELYPLLGVTENSLDALSSNYSYHTSLFQLFDGTIVLAGYNRLLWHDIEIVPDRIQVLPRMFRVYPSYRSHSRALLWAVWCRVFLGIPLPLRRWRHLYSFSRLLGRDGGDEEFRISSTVRRGNSDQLT